MNSKQVTKTAIALLSVLIMVPAVAFADDTTAFDGFDTSSTTANSATVAPVVVVPSLFDGFDTTGTTTNSAIVQNPNGFDGFDTTGSTSNSAIVQNPGGFDGFDTTGTTSNSGTTTPDAPIVPTAPADNSGGGGNGGGGGGRSGGGSGGSSSALVISPLYIVRNGTTNTYWVAFTTSASVEGQLLYGTNANSVYENATSFDGASITHSFTVTLKPNVINYLRPVARIGTTLYTGVESTVVPTQGTIIAAAPVGTVAPDNTNVDNGDLTAPASTTDTVGTDASTTASTTEDNTANVSNAFFGPVGDFFHRMWNYITRSMCELPS